MGITKNAEKLQQHQSRFSLIVEQIMAFSWSTNLVKKVKNLPPNLKQTG